MRWIQKLKHDTGGNVLMLTGLAILFLFAMAGAGVDFGRQQLVRMKLQNASDAAAVAAASMPASVSAEQRRAVALRYYNLNFPTTYLGVPRPTPNIQIGEQIIVDASTSFNANFVSNVGVQELQSQGRTVVDRSAPEATVYDVILVMDNSNSMSFETTAPAFSPTPSGQIQNARNLINQYCRNEFIAISNGMCSSSFNRPVMANGYQRSAAYPNLNLCRQTWPTDMCSGKTNGANPYAPQPGCNPNNINCYGYAYGFTGNTRLNALRSVTLGFVDRIITEGAPGSRIGLITWSSDVIAPQPLTDNTETLRQRINNMAGVGATNPVTAMQQAVTMSGTFDPTHVKAVVFLTDGSPTLAGPRNSNGNDSFGCNGGNFCPPAVIRTNTVCSQLKSSGVQVYTVGFLNANDLEFRSNPVNFTSAQNFLRNCASVDAEGNPRYYGAQNGAELELAFTQILTSLGRIRISQ